MIKKFGIFKDSIIDMQFGIILNALNNNKKQPPTLLNGVINYDSSTYESASYIKTAASESVLVSGVLTLPVGFSAGGVMFALPERYRPLKRQVFPAINLGGGTVQIDVLENGDVISQTGGNISLSLCGMNFIAEK